MIFSFFTRYTKNRFLFLVFYFDFLLEARALGEAEVVVAFFLLDARGEAATAGFAADFFPEDALVVVVFLTEGEATAVGVAGGEIDLGVAERSFCCSTCCFFWAANFFARFSPIK